MDAKQILHGALSTYEDCLSYEDAGTFSHTLIGLKESTRSDYSFKTKYVRPDLLLFEWSNLTMKRDFVFQSLGETIRLIIYRDNAIIDVTSFPDLLTGILVSTGVSGGLINGASSLIFPIHRESLIYRYSAIDSVRRLDDVTVDDIECFQIELIWNKPIGKETLLISKIDQSVRRIEWDVTVPSTEASVAETNKIRRFTNPDAPPVTIDTLGDSMSSVQNFTSITFNNSLTIDAFEPATSMSS